MLKSLILVLAIIGATYGQYNGYASVEAPPKQTELFNPCTEEVMRASEIQLFVNANDQASYLICTDVNTPISMPCSPGTVFDQNLRHCIPLGWEAPRCPVGTCFNNADCVIDEMNRASCICRVGFTGERCEINIDECALGGNSACSDYKGVCVDQINAYYCEYSSGNEIGLSWSNRIERPCSLVDIEAGKQFYELVSEQSNVFLQCTSEFTFLVTKCADMLFWHQELRTCSIDRPSEKTGVCKNYPCRNDGVCMDMGGNSFTCTCKEGYTGDMCEEIIDFCLNKPCQMGGRCVSHPGGFNCICKDLIVDQSCATGVYNPCAGSSGYMTNSVDFTKYISCSLNYGFVKSCAPGLKWNQDTLTCILIEEVIAPQHVRPTAQLIQRPMAVQSTYGQQPQMTQRPMAPAPVQSSYGQMQVAPMAQAPVQSSYGQVQVTPMAPAPVQSSYGQVQVAPMAPAPVQSSYGQQPQMIQRPLAPAPVQPSYGQQPQMIQRPMTPIPVQSSYGQQQQMIQRPLAPAPVQSSYGQVRVTPMAPVPAPVQSSYGQVQVTPMAPVPAPVQPSYGQVQEAPMAPAPVQPSYGQQPQMIQRPMATAPVQPSYGQQPQMIQRPQLESRPSYLNNMVLPPTGTPVAPPTPSSNPYGQKYGSRMLSFFKQD